MQAHTLSFRAGDAFVTETRALAEQAGLKSSDYIREAVREKNERMMAERIAALARSPMASPKVKRGQVWAVDFEPQTHKQEPGKRNRPALVIQTNLLNDAGHATTIVIPGTSDVEREDCFPLRVALGRLPGQAVDEATDLLIDQIRAISNDRLMGDKPITTLNTNQLRRVEDALRLLMNL
ncbi:hypothetical protein DL771_012203 [Monosporascus sp. 5C6A]|nr:hypothetical protein DL763_011495 [Monosporascus cannonballus]RYP56009.1 hypothetical protein DL771_012203 [Monosporascus sp. 5C6A]